MMGIMIIIIVITNVKGNKNIQWITVLSVGWLSMQPDSVFIQLVFVVVIANNIIDPVCK